MEEGIPLKEKYKDMFSALAEYSTAAAKIDPTNVYQPANLKTRAIMEKLVSDNTLPESHFEGLENFEKFYDQVCAGKHGLIFMEHYSNADMPSFMYQLKKSGNPKLEDLANRIVAIAGMKLNEENGIVRALCESYTRVVVYPTRSQAKIENSNLSSEEIAEEEAKAKKINLAAMRAMDHCKRNGEVILVFPAGTRYRPGHPETKRGLREMDSYIRLFDTLLMVSINGTILQLQDEDMLNDLCRPAKVVFSALEPIDCREYRKTFMAQVPADCEDPKQLFIDDVMKKFDAEHQRITEKEGTNN